MKPFLLLLAFICNLFTATQAKQPYKIIAYYTGDGKQLEQYRLDQLTHIIFSFVALRHDSLQVRDAAQEKTIRQIVALKQKYPQLKIMVSMGGWSGCAPCSDLFAKAKHRNTFAKTTVALLQKYHLDGIDLDWEYPAIEGFPGHKYDTADKRNFTLLLQALRKEMGNRYLLTFAAGGFVKYLEQSIDWPAVHPLVDFVNLMTYDLVGGYATVTGHHTPLYSYREGQESTDRCVNWLLDHGVPANKLITGAAFYARVWEKVAEEQNGLYQSGVFKEAVDYNRFGSYFADGSGFRNYWDNQSQAPYQYNAEKQLFATFDNERSIAEKANYVRQRELGGIMFWELTLDQNKDGLLNELWKVLR
jgi:chitinase